MLILRLNKQTKLAFGLFQNTNLATMTDVCAFPSEFSNSATLQMFETGRKVIGQVWSMFDKPSASARNSRNGLFLGKVEETDFLGVALHKEATHGSRRALKKVLNKAICVDYPNDLGQTPLFCACARDNESTAVLLLQWRANPNEKSLDGMTPCHAATYTGNVYLLGKLIEAGGDLRLHDNNGNSMRDWALKNSDVRKRSKMLEFIDKTQMRAMACSGEAVSSATVMAPASRPHMQTSVMDIMRKKTGSDVSFESLKRVQSTGFGRVYLGNNYNGGIISAVPLISEAALLATDEKKYDTGFHSCIERMHWLNESVSVKQLKPDVGSEDGIDLLITDAEFLGKLRHPNILLLMGICQSTYLDRIMLVFEHVENLTLQHFLHQTTNPLSNHDCLSIIQQICAAMDFIHCQHLIHCGLSSMAVYLVSSQATKVGNFEFMVESIKTDLGKPSPVSLVSHGEFLYNWMSPELIQGLAPHYSSDVYSFCCIVWELFTREVPWQNLRPESIRRKIVEEKTGININAPKVPPNMKAIIGYGLELKEERRLNKFSFIIDWMKNDQVPKFQRTNTPHYLRNKSDNFAEQLSFSSASSSSSVRPETNPWVQDRLDFIRVNQSAEDTCTSDSLSALCEEMDKDDSTLSLCNNFESSKRLAPNQKPYKHGLASVSGHTNICKKSRKDRKCVSDSDLEQHQTSAFLTSKLIKPASHSQGFNPGHQSLPGCDPDHLHLVETNSRASAPIMLRNYASHTKCGSHYGKPESGGSVRKLADLYQVRLFQHKLRQAILKGSMAPRGSCQDLESSSESIKRSCDSQDGEGKCHLCEDAKHVCMKKSLADMDTTSALAVDACKSSPLKNSTPREHVGPDRKIKQQLALENRDSDSQKQLPCRHGGDGHDGCIDTHQVLLQEVKAVHQKLMSRSVGAVNKFSFSGNFHSPDIETCCPAKHCRHLSKFKDTNSAPKLQSDEPLHRKVKIQNACKIPDETGKEKNFECDVNSEIDAHSNIDHQILDESCDVDYGQPIIKVQESHLSFKERYSLVDNADVLGKRSFIIRNIVGELSSKKHHRTSETAEPGYSLLKENKQTTINPAGADGATYDLETAATHMYNVAAEVSIRENKQMTVSPAEADHVVPEVGSHVDSACCIQNTSVDSERVAHWIDSKLAKIKEKVRLRPSKLDQGTESDDSLHGLTDISTASTLTVDGGKEEKKSDLHTAVSEADEELKVDKSGDFEFREFYIDDDLDSTQYHQPDNSNFQVPIPNSSTSTQHSAVDSATPTVAAGNVKKKAEFFLQIMTNFKPPMFPRKPKKMSDLSEKNISCSDLSADNKVTEGQKTVSSRDVCGRTFESEVACPCLSERMNGLPKVMTTSGSAIDGQTQARQVTSGDGPCNGDFPSKQLTKMNQKSKDSLNKDDRLHRFKEHTIINRAVEEQTIINNDNFKDPTDPGAVPESPSPLDQVDTACGVRHLSQLCKKGNKVNAVDCVTEACQTSITQMYHKSGITAGSDSDSDSWVKSRLITIQKKIQRRRARLAYSVSSDESSNNDEFSLSQQLSTDMKHTVNHGKISTQVSDGSAMRSDEENINVVSSKRRKNHSQNSGTAGKKSGKTEQKVNELQHIATNRDRWNERLRKESLSQTESCLRKKKLKSKKPNLSPKPAGRIPRQHHDDLISHCAGNRAEVTASKRPGPEMPIRQDSVVSTVVNSNKKKSSSKSSKIICTESMDNSKVNDDCKGSVKSMNLSEVSAREWRLWKPFKKMKDSTSSHGCKTSVYESTSKKSHHSILRRPRNLLTNAADLGTTGMNSFIPSPTRGSRSKFSLGHDSKVSDRVISFQDLSDSEPEMPDSEKGLVPLKQSKLFNEGSLQRKEKLDSSEYDELVKTWLERENFAERVSLDSSRQVDHQSITSKVMEMQSISSKQAGVPREISVPASSLQSGHAPLKPNGTLMTSKQSTSRRHETGRRKHSASNDVKGCTSLSWVDIPSIRSDSATNELAVELDHIQARFSRRQSKSDHDSQKCSLSQGRDDKNTWPGNINNDHCLILDLSSFSKENSTESTFSLTGSKKPSHMGVHRFYIPHERCPSGCTAKLNVSINATDPAVHRITSTTTDPVSGLTETLLDETVCTHQLRSTMQLE